MSGTKSFIKRGILLTAVGLAMKTAGMFFGSFLSRSIGAEGIGIYTLITTVYSLSVTVATSGISLTVTRLVASSIGRGRGDEIGRVLCGAFLYSAIFGVLASLGLFFGAELIGEVILSDARTVSSLRILSFSLFPAAISSALSGYFIGVKRVGFNASATIICQILKIFLTVWLVSRLSSYGTVSAVVGVCLGITITETVACGVMLLEFLYDWHKYGGGSKIRNPQLSAVAGTALPLAFSTYVRSILLNVEHILIPKKLREFGQSSAEAYADYGTLHGMALPLIIYPMSPLSSFAGLLVPEFAEDMSAGREGRMSRIASRAINLTLTYGVICATLIYGFAEELGYIVYDSYDAGYYISALSVVIPIMYLDHVTDSVLKGIGEQVFSMWVNITDSLLSVALVWILIPRMGIMGYAVVIIIMEGYNFLLSFLRLRKKIKFRIKPIKAIIVPLCISSLSVFISRKLFVFCGSTTPPIWLVLKLVFSLALTVFALSSLETLPNIRLKIKTHKNKKRLV